MTLCPSVRRSLSRRKAQTWSSSSFHSVGNRSQVVVAATTAVGILDWGEACIDDALYDAAWAAVTTVVYAGVRDYQTFMATYRVATDLALVPAAQALREAVA